MNRSRRLAWMWNGVAVLNFATSIVNGIAGHPIAAAIFAACCGVNVCTASLYRRMARAELPEARAMKLPPGDL